MNTTKAYVICESEEHLAELYREGLIGSWNGAYLADGSCVVAVPIQHGSARARIDAHPNMTLLPSHTTPSAKVSQEQLAKVPTSEGPLRLQKAIGETGRDLAEQLHATYGDVTSALDPDGP